MRYKLYCIAAMVAVALPLTSKGQDGIDESSVAQVPAPASTSSLEPIATSADFPADIGLTSATTTSAGRPDHYTEIEYLLWSIDGGSSPALLTSNPTGTPLANIGSLTDPSTRVVMGGDDFGGVQSGIRARYGHMLRGDLASRLELSGWWLFSNGSEWNFESSPENPILARPFVNAQTGLADAQVISFPGLIDGSMQGTYDRRLFGIDPMFFGCISGSGNGSLEYMTGYKFLRYEDELVLVERISPAAGGLIAPGTEIQVEDRFAARNDYHLLPLGLNFTRTGKLWRLGLRVQTGIGYVHQRLDVRGRTTTTVNGDVTSVEDGGLLALSSNSGIFDRNEFAWVPEFNLTFRRNIRGGLWANVGYTFVYLSDVVQAVSHIDSQIDPNLVPPALSSGTRPAFSFQSDDAVIHGLNAGLQWNY
jgi:hypothetical protein